MTQTPAPAANKKIPVIAAIMFSLAFLCLLVILCYISAIILFSEKKPLIPSNAAQTSTRLPQQTSIVRPTVEPEDQTWLVMLYFDADDPVLEEDILFDLNEAELAGSNGRVRIVAQVDRFKKGYKGDGNWTGAKRFEVFHDTDLNIIRSRVVDEPGEVDMSDPQVLTDFAVWAIQTYPADRHVLILSDHGMGWPGGWTDADNHGDDFVFISTAKLEKALQSIVKSTGISQFDIVGLDACLMGMLEVYSAAAPYSRYMVASEEVEPGLGWAYAGFLTALTNSPEMSPADLAKTIVETYIKQDQRIINREAREEFLKKSGLDPEMPQETMIKGLAADSTLAAVDLSAIQSVHQKLNSFVTALKEVDQRKLADSRSYARAFTNTFDDSLPSPYLDLSNFTALAAKRVESETATKAASALRIAIDQAIVAETHGPNRRGSTGMSIYFPVSELYWNQNVGARLYTTLASRFAKSSLWDDFLAFHYAGQDFNKGIPDISQKLPAPGFSEDILISPLKLSNNSIKPGDTLRVQTSVSGNQIAYIYLLTLLEKDKDNYLLYYLDYFRGVDVREEDGVYYPVWKMDNGLIPIDIQWVPSSFGVCNGKICSFAHLNPEAFGKLDKESIYSTAGRYVFKQDEITRDARMYFKNDDEAAMTRITGFTGGTATGLAAAPINPAPGDEWQFVDTWLSRNESGGFSFTYRDGNRIAFGKEPFYFGIRPSDSGQYRVAIMVQDMDGNYYFQFAPLTINK